MGDSPSAHLWFGTRPTEEHPWVIRYEGDKEVVPDEDPFDAKERINGADGPTVLVSLCSGYGGDCPMALAVAYHRADWDSAMDLGALEPPPPWVLADLLRVALEEGWLPVTVDDLAWHLGASYG